MKKIRSILLTLGLVICNLITSNAFAQDPGFPGFPGNDDPGLPVAPINDWVIPVLIIGIGFAFMVYRKMLKLESK
jgi:hypothetical protein